MTKKRVKFGLILGGLAAFLLALLALVFAPTGASAGKGPAFGQEQDGGGQPDHSNLAYFQPPSGAGSGNNPAHSEEGVSPCVGTLCDTQDSDAPGGEPWHYADGEGGGGNNPGGNSLGGDHAPNPDSGDHGPAGHGNPWLFAGGGFPGGGYGEGGTPQDQSNACTSQKDKDEDSKDKESGDKKTCDTDKSDSSNNGDNGNNDHSGDEAGFPQLSQLDDKNSDPNDDSSDNPPGNTGTNLVSGPPGDEDLPPVDPNCLPFTEGCDTHNGNPPDTVLTDPPNKVPEPLTLSLFAVGLTGAAVLRRRQNKAARPD
jgi:hypothetical protein